MSRGCPGVAKAAEDGAQHVVGNNEQCARSADENVVDCAAHGLFRRLKQPGNRPGQGKDEGGQDNADDAELPDCGADILSALLGFSLTDMPSEKNRGSHSHARNCILDQLHELAPGGDGRDVRGRSELADDQQIDRAVERLQEQGSEDGELEPDQRTQDGPLCEILYTLFCHNSLLINKKAG